MCQAHHYGLWLIFKHTSVLFLGAFWPPFFCSYTKTSVSNIKNHQGIAVEIHLNQTKDITKTFKIMKKAIILLTTLAIVLTSCDSGKKKERQMKVAQLQSELVMVQSELGAIQTELSLEKSRLNDHKSRKFQLESKLADYEQRVEAYLMDHKMAVASIAAGFGGAAVAFDPNNQFNQEVKDVAAIVGTIAAVYALFNMDELIEVGDVLLQADVNVRSLESQIRNVESNIYLIEKNVRTKESKINQLSNAVYSTQNEIKALSI